MNAIPPLSLIALCVALVLLCGCTECDECAGGAYTLVTSPPIATPRIEVLEFKGFVVFRDPVTMTARVEYSVPGERAPV